MHIDVEMMSGENMPHEMETTDNIMEIKKRIQDKAGVDPTVLKLHYSDDEQPNDTTLDILKNKAGSNSVSLVAKERVNVSVKMMSGAEDKFQMFTYDSVLDVKKKVSEKEHIEHILIHLNLDGAEIHDDQSLEDIK
jgi:ubiquitin C